MKLNLQLFGRAYEVRKASIQKNGAVKAKLYSNYAKEIFLAAPYLYTAQPKGK